MEKVLHARQEARQALLAAREQEEYILAQHKKQKSEWLLELQTRAMEARQVRPHPLTTPTHYIMSIR